MVTRWMINWTRYLCCFTLVFFSSISGQFRHQLNILLFQDNLNRNNTINGSPIFHPFDCCLLPAKKVAIVIITVTIMQYKNSEKLHLENKIFVLNWTELQWQFCLFVAFSVCGRNHAISPSQPARNKEHLFHVWTEALGPRRGEQASPEAQSAASHCLSVSQSALASSLLSNSWPLPPEKSEAGA